MKKLIMEIELYAKENNVPIIEKESIAFMMKYIKAHNVKNILEIGSAIGYSSILMASSTPEVNVTTMERDHSWYLECLNNVKKAGLEKKINVVFQDALEVNLNNDIKYDLIFIDAAKAQYQKFFEKFKYFLTSDGVIISDNLKFHGLVGTKEEIKSKNVKGIVRKLENYVEFLKNNEEFTTDFYDLGDGLSVSKRKNEE